MAEKKTRVLIIDGDVLCHMSCKEREESVHGFIAVDDDGNEIKRESAEYTEEENEAYLQKSFLNLQSMISGIMKFSKADYHVMGVKSSTNYRDWIFPPEFLGTPESRGYKAQRSAGKEEKRNTFVPKLRQMAIDNGIAIESHDREADDLCGIWATEAEAAGHEWIMASIDKDLHRIPGKHLKIKDWMIITVSPNYATRFAYEQYIMGDQTDNIPGIPKMGPKKAEAALEPYDTEREFQAVVIEEYRKYYGRNWKSYLLANGKLLYIQRAVNDYFHIRGWAQFEKEPDWDVVEEEQRLAKIAAELKESQKIRRPRKPKVEENV